MSLEYAHNSTVDAAYSILEQREQPNNNVWKLHVN